MNTLLFICFATFSFSTAQWTMWTEWSGCSMTCTGPEGYKAGKKKAHRVKFRTCKQPLIKHDCHKSHAVGKKFAGKREEMIINKTHALDIRRVNCLRKQNKYAKNTLCPIHGGWTVWTSTDPCLLTDRRDCISGKRKERRTCTNPKPQRKGARDCKGPDMRVHVCKLSADLHRKCPIDGKFTKWSDIYSCPKTCGGSFFMQERTCNAPFPENGGNYCDGPHIKVKPCAPKNCTSGNSNWSNWGKCSTSCGKGVKKRTRSCTWHLKQDCTGPRVEEKACIDKPCPVDGGYSQFKESHCSTSCGPGFKVRSRECTSPSPKHGGQVCKGPMKEKVHCFLKPCVTDGGWTPWTSFTPCSRTCGRGIHERTRSCTAPMALGGGKHCPGPEVEREECVDSQCVIDGGLSEWVSFGGCSVTCGLGNQKRRRTCTNPKPQHGGTECVGHVQEGTPCFPQPCPVHGGLTQWAIFAACSVTCGTGVRMFIRSCTSPVPEHGGNKCQGNLTKMEPCSLDVCPEWRFHPWSDWTSCNASVCEIGEIHRTRECDMSTGFSCVGDAVERAACHGKCVTITFHRRPHDPIDIDTRENLDHMLEGDVEMTTLMTSLVTAMLPLVFYLGIYAWLYRGPIKKVFNRLWLRKKGEGLDEAKKSHIGTKEADLMIKLNNAEDDHLHAPASNAHAPHQYVNRNDNVDHALEFMKSPGANEDASLKIPKYQNSIEHRKGTVRQKRTAEKENRSSSKQP